MSTTSSPIIVCWGPVRGYCGVEHGSIESTSAHVRKDRIDCKAGHGYSDREAYRASDLERNLQGDYFAVAGGYAENHPLTSGGEIITEDRL